MFKELHDVILGCGFLVENGAIIDYAHDELLLSEEPSYNVAQITIPCLSVEFDRVLFPQSTSFISV